MSDISKCSETSCMKKDTCRRFTDPAGLNQSYTEPLNFNKKEGCDLHNRVYYKERLWIKK